MWRLMRFAFPIPVLLGLTLLATTTAAASDPTLSFSSTGELTNRTAVTLTVNVTCPQGEQIEMTDVTVEQAAGQAIARASGGLPVSQCTGSLETASVTLLADVNGPPFHGGQAVVSGFYDLFDPTTFSFTGVSATAAIKLAG